MQRHVIAAALLVLGTVSCTQTVIERAPSNDVTSMPSEQPALRQAAEKAQATLDDFLTKAKLQPAGTSSYALKAGIQQGRDTEYFWFEEFTWSDGAFTGRINNEPRLLTNVKSGQVVRFNRSQVADWKYVDDKTGRTFGNFAACAQLAKEAPAQADEIKRREGLDCR